jgi:hypothetical protein
MRRGLRIRAWGLAAAMILSLVVVVTDRAPETAAVPPSPLPSAAGFGWTQGGFSVSEDGAAHYSLPLWVSAGRGAITPNLSRLDWLTLVPESAPLITHVTQVSQQHVIIAGSSDDDAAQAAQKVKEARMLTKILKLAYGGIGDPYDLLELDREASKARAERYRGGGTFWAWAAGDY